MFRIRPRPLNGTEKLPPPVQKPDYRAFIKSLPCAVSHMEGVDAAHLSEANPIYGHTGRGKAQRANGIWILPLCRKQHDLQHSMKETDYWSKTGIDPWRLCLVLWGIYSSYGMDGIPVANEAIRRAKL